MRSTSCSLTRTFPSRASKFAVQICRHRVSGISAITFVLAASFISLRIFLICCCQFSLQCFGSFIDSECTSPYLLYPFSFAVHVQQVGLRMHARMKPNRKESAESAPNQTNQSIADPLISPARLAALLQSGDCAMSTFSRKSELSGMLMSRRSSFERRKNHNNAQWSQHRYFFSASFLCDFAVH